MPTAADADALFAELFRLPPEEQTRFALMLIGSLDERDLDLFRSYHRVLDTYQVSPDDKPGYYRALDLAVQDEAPERVPAPSEPASNLFDLDFDVSEEDRQRRLQRLREAYQFQRRAQADALP